MNFDQDLYFGNSLNFDANSFDEYLNIQDATEKCDDLNNDGENKKDQKDLPCVVCGARAFGYNFDQISCESCKAFFRRNALKNLNELHCRYSGDCIITVETRRHCAYCRINKCFAVGMKKERIRTEEEKRMKRYSTGKIRRRKFFPKQNDNSTLSLPRIQLNYRFLSSLDRVYINNIIHSYDKYAAEPISAEYRPPAKPVYVRLDQYFNFKKSVYTHFISFFKRIPELEYIHIDDQVLLMKQNIRILMPFNFAILRAPANTKFQGNNIHVTGCINNINIPDILRSTSDLIIGFAMADPIILKILMLVFFFTPEALTVKTMNSQAQFKQSNYIHQIQSFYMQLLWTYLIEKCGEKSSINLFTKIIGKMLQIQSIINYADYIIEMNNDASNLDSLMKTMLQLT